MTEQKCGVPYQSMRVYGGPRNAIIKVSHSKGLKEHIIEKMNICKENMKEGYLGPDYRLLSNLCAV